MNMLTPNPVLYTAKANVSGGRDGAARSDDGKLAVQLSTPAALGGGGGEGTNPEQLFAAGYAACFIGALKLAATRRDIALPDGLGIDSEVGIGPVDDVFAVRATLNISLPGMDKDAAEALVDAAHQICPYSNATRGNIEIDLRVSV